MDFDELENLLKDPQKNYEKLHEFMTQTFSKDNCHPSYSSLRKHFGMMCLNRNDTFMAAFHFQESLGAALRTHINLICDTKIFSSASNDNNNRPTQFEISPFFKAIEDKLLEKDDNTNWSTPLINELFKKFKTNVRRKRLEHSRETHQKRDSQIFRDALAHKYIYAHTVENMIQHNKNLPPEWTIIQITKAPEIHEQIEQYSQDSLNPVAIYITLFSGDNLDIKSNDPITVSIKPNQDPGSQYVLSEILTTLSKYEKNKADSIPLSLYWKQHDELEDTYRKLVSEFNEWIGGWACLFLGKLTSNRKDYKIICTSIDDCIGRSNVSFHQKVLLYRLASYVSNCDSFRFVSQILGLILPGPDFVEPRSAIENLLRQKWKTPGTYANIMSAERGPVILIIDERLDKLPWEALNCFQKQSVSRVHCLHLLHALYYRNEDKIKKGYYMIEKIIGKYVLNSEMNLPKMERRMSAFFDYWLPDWTGRTGCRLTDQEYAKILRSCTVFCYAGHGGGATYLPFDDVEKQMASCVALLSGCSSTCLLKSGRTEAFGLHLSYHIAGSPCILGNLWSVTDHDSDRLLTRILSTWIPGPKNKKHFLNCNVDKWSEGIIDPVNERTSVPPKRQKLLGPLHQNILLDDDLLKVLSLSRGYAASLFNSSALIARGIPVKITNKE